MGWNEPGNNQDPSRDPWSGKKNSSPPDLDKMLGDLMKKIRAFWQGGSSGGYQPRSSSPQQTGITLSAVAIIIFFIWFLSGLFIVNPAEEAVILRFGKYADVVQPGLHWMARFVDTKYLVDVQKVYSFSIQGDFLTKSSEQSDLPNQVVQTPQPTTDTVGADKSKNLVNVEMNVQYHINNPRAYLFNVINPDDTIQEVSSGALSDVVGKMKLDDVLTTGRDILSAGVLTRVKQVMSSYNAGIDVLSVSLRKIQAPDQVRAAFNDVNRADQDKATYIQQAQAYASKVVPLAQGAAARILADAKGYQQQVVLTAEAHVAKFKALAKVYAASPEVTRERMYLEAMQNILKNTSKVLVDGSANNNILYLPIDKLMKLPEEAKNAVATDAETTNSTPAATASNEVKP